MTNECLSASSNCKSKILLILGLFPIANFPTDQKIFNKYIKK